MASYVVPNSQSLGSQEAEWLSSTISQFIGGVCGISESPPLLLTAITSTAVSAEIAPIAHKWHSEQLLNDIDFDVDEAPQTSRSKPSSESSPITARVLLTNGHNDETSHVVQEPSPAADSRIGAKFQNDVPRVDGRCFEQQRSTSFDTVPNSMPSWEEFGNKFREAAIGRLQLPDNLGLQMARIQELAGSRQCLEREKSRIRSELKGYDAAFAQKFGSLPDRVEKEPLRPLYLYYRRVKMAIQRASKGMEEEIVIDEVTKEEKSLLKLHRDKNLIRHRLQVFQDEFIKTQGRPVKFHRDIVPIDHEYKQYKQLKEHIRKIEEAIRRKKAMRLMSNIRIGETKSMITHQ